jgi:3-methyladenine DNA glycosylase AlkC
MSNSWTQLYKRLQTTDNFMLLAVFSTKKEAYLREKVASNPNCPECILRMLAKDKRVYVRYSVADNVNCPANILLTISKEDDYATIREAAIQNLKKKHLTA